MRVSVALVSIAAAHRIQHKDALSAFRDTLSQYPTVPTGVNLGGWFCLEDWFHSANGKFVSTPLSSYPDGQGACLPPGLTQHDTRWQSEGRLVKQLADKHGSEKAIEIFTQHRAKYITDSDLDAIAAAGIKSLRIPVTWAMFPDGLHDVDPIYTSFNPDHDVRVVPDPYYNETHAMVTIPRGWMAEILRKCADRGLKVNWDIHAHAGGQSEGTFNGIWPAQPKFWIETPVFGNTQVPLRDVGVQVAKKLFDWVGTLPAKEKSAVMGVSPMNEPAHLAWGTAEWGGSDDVLKWYAEVGGLFRTSGLAQHGIKLYVQLINTAFPDWGVNFLNISSAWFSQTFTEEEQKTWAVMDHHWYSAWSGAECSGRAAGVEGGAYNCDAPSEKIIEILRSENCLTPWAEDFHTAFPHLKAISEFSIGTFHEADKACKDKRNRDLFLDEQVKMWNKFNIEPFFWTWRVPYAPEFEPGWSLKYILGLEQPQQDLDEVCKLPVDDKYIPPEEDTDDGTHQTE